MTAPHTTLFTAADYAALAAIVFRHDYPGFATARGVVEAPNGDPGARDTGKRYSHVALKYLQRYDSAGPTEHEMLRFYLDRAFARATAVATALGVPETFMPSFEHGALRVLEYPPGAGSHTHTDFDLFTLACWRDRPEGLVRQVPDMLPGQIIPAYSLADLDKVDPGLHLGELGELIGLGPATPHKVVSIRGGGAEMLLGPAGCPSQHSIVYFAIPDHAAVLHGGTTVGEWLAERLARSRYDR
jgi:hypothetical protein